MTPSSFKSTLFALTLLLSLAACEKDPIETPPPTTIPPQQQLPNPLPANARIKQMKWTEIDHQTFTYNAEGQVAQLRSQWQYVEGDPTKIRTIVYDFQYDAQDRPVQITLSDGFTVRYFYHGNLIHLTKEFYPGGAVAREVTYIYAGDRISHETWRVSNAPGEPVSVYKHAFSYDARGNLSKVDIYEQQENLQYQLLETVEYSEFDDKINPTSWLNRYPYLPQLRLQYNNPGKEIRRPVGSAAETTNYAYTYNAQGLPAQKRTTRPMAGESTVQLVY